MDDESSSSFNAVPGTAGDGQTTESIKGQINSKAALC